MGQVKNSLGEDFLQYFDVALATTEAQKREVYHIRYRVYCEEFGYEPAESFPDHQEIDVFDAASLHCIITHKGSGLPAGCVRLVKPVDFAEGQLLPFEKNCRGRLDTALLDSLRLNRAEVCEVSRLAVDGAFRRRSGERLTRFGEVEGLDCTQRERRTFALIAVACFLSATALTGITNRTNVFALMEPFLPKLLQRSGIVFQRVGQDIDYHGFRAPYFITTQSAVDNMLADLRELYKEIHQRLIQDMPSDWQH